MPSRWWKKYPYLVRTIINKRGYRNGGLQAQALFAYDENAKCQCCSGKPNDPVLTALQYRVSAGAGFSLECLRKMVEKND